MHAVVMESLEEYLAGALEPAAQRNIEAHLSVCPSCSEEVRGMQDLSLLFGSLKAEDAPAPLPGFYAGVMQLAEAQKPAPSFASLFSLDLNFGRRLVFASLLTLAVMGGYLVSREADFPGGISPDAIMAQQDAPSFNAAPAQDNMLVTLAAYER